MAPELWTNACLVSIAKQGSDNVEFAAITDDIDIDPGMRDIIQINGVGGGCTTEHVPQTLGTMTINAFPLEIGTPSGTTGLGFWDLLQTADTAQALEIGNSKNRDKIRIALLWTDDRFVTSAADAISDTTATITRIDTSLGIATITGGATTINVSTSQNHNRWIGESIEVDGTTNYNGTYTIASISSATVFSITDSSHNVASEATGTITSSPSRFSVTASGGHSFRNSDTISITSTSTFNGTYIIDRVLSSTVFTIADTTIHSAETSGTITLKKNAQRIVFADAFVVDVKDEWRDGELVCRVTVKVTAFDSGDNATTPYNVLEQSTNATAAISALNAYTKSVKF